MRYRIAKLERLLGDLTLDPSVGLRTGVALEILHMQQLAGGRAAGTERRVMQSRKHGSIAERETSLALSRRVLYYDRTTSLTIINSPMGAGP